MKINLSLLVILFVYITNSNQEKVKLSNDFIIVCSDIQKNQLLFDGKCNLSPDNIFPSLNELVSYILSLDSKLTIDDLFRNYLLNGYTEFFENKYSKNSEYLNALIDFKSEFDSFGKKLENSIQNVKMNEFYLMFENSNMTNVIDQIVTNNDDEYYNNFENVNYSDYYCETGSGFCDKSELMYGLKKLDAWSNLTLDEALRKAFETAYNFIIKRPLKQDVLLNLAKEEFIIYDLINLLKNQGTKNTLVSSLHTFLDMTFAKQMVEYFDPKSETNLVFTKKTTTKTTTLSSTTRAPKVIPVTAVSEAVLIAVPVGLVLFGLIGAGVFAYFGFFSIQILKRRNKTNVQVLEMSTVIETRETTLENGAKRTEKF